jgi:HSP20 family protein
MPGESSNPSTPVNNPWDFDVATSAPNPALQPQHATSSTNHSTPHPAEFSPEELFSTSATPAVSSPTVIQLEERIPVVPSQYHRSRIRAAGGESRPRTHVQRDASSANAEQPAGTSEGTAPSSGLVRTSLTNVRAERTRPHPYRRPHSADAGGTASRASSTGAGKASRSVSDQARTSPLMGDNSSGLAQMRYAALYSFSLPPTLSVPSPMWTLTIVPARSPPYAPGTALSRPTSPSKVYSIRTDIHLNIDTNTMVAMLELPGVKHDDLSVTLATEPYTHARQITVAGRTYPPFAEPVPEERERMKRERKFGDFLRRLHVPPRTQVGSYFCVCCFP